jgi:Tol biopolymer transport system component
MMFAPLRFLVFSIVCFVYPLFSQHTSFELKHFSKQKKAFEQAHNAFTKGSIAFEEGYNKWALKQKQILYKRKFYPLSIRDYERAGFDAFQIALEALLKAEQFNAKHHTLQFMIGFCQFVMSPRSAEAAAHFKQSRALGMDNAFDAFYWMAWSEQMQSNWIEAENLYTTYAQMAEHDHKFTNPLKECIRKRIDECQWGARLSKQAIAVSVENMGPLLNTKYPEYAPCITADQSQLFFTSRRPGALNRTKDPSDGLYLEDIYGSTCLNKMWQPPYLLKGNINSEGHDAVCGVNNAGNRLFVFKSDINNGGDIFESTFNGNDWSAPIAFSAPVNSAHYENAISLNPYEKRIYFTSDRQGAQSDIYTAELQAKGWAGIKNIGEPVNSGFDETAVFLHPDGKTLYFSSQAYGSMGGFDIFYSTLESGKWSKPVNMGYPINGPDDDVFFVLSGDGSTAYYSANRAEGFGDLDLYKIHFLKDTVSNVRPILPVPDLYLVKGVISGLPSQKPLDATVSVYDADKNELLYSASTNSVDGKYLVSLPSGKNYAFHVYKSGYIFKSENFNIPEHPAFKEIILNLDLEPLISHAEIPLNNLFFDVNASTLKPASHTELNRLLELLNANPGISIEIISHTDNTGNSAFNTDLSNARSATVINYLISKGISLKRLKASGKGETEPLESNATAEGRAKNRRTTFRIMP